jgi:hypothetical protein
MQSGEALAKAEEREKSGPLTIQSCSRACSRATSVLMASKLLVRQVGDLFDEPSLNDVVARLNASVSRQVANLESIIERVELVDETSAGPAEAAASQDRSKVFVVHGHNEGALQSWRVP